MKDDLRYTATDCFETFAFPCSYRNNPDLERIGHKYYDKRAQLMTQMSIGVTGLYNRFHDPDERKGEIMELRHLHDDLDVAVLRAYDWDDLADKASQTDFCQFLLDYEEDEDDTASDSSGTRQKKKPWRYRWPDEFRDEVLARLLELNEQRHKEEVIAGVAIDAHRKSSDDEDESSDDEESKPAKPIKPKQPRQSKKTKKPDNPDQPKFEF